MQPLPPDDHVHRVLLFLPHLAVGGAELQSLMLARALPSCGFRPIVVSMEDRHGTEQRFASAGIDVRFIRRSRASLGPIVELARLARSQHVEIVHAWLFSANWRAAAVRTVTPHLRVLFSVRSLEEDLGATHVLAYRLAARLADFVLVNSDAVRVCSMGKTGLPATRYRLIRNGVDVDQLVSAAERAAIRQTGLEGSPVIGYVGSLSPRKRVETLARIAPAIAARIPKARFLVVGDGESRSALAAACRRHGVEERFFFAGQQEEVAPWVNLMTVLVHPSRNEGSSNAILEAQALGVPVVAYAVSGNLETVVPNETGLLVPDGDETSLASAALSILSSAALRGSMSRRARQMVRHCFSVAAMVGQTVAAYRSVLERRGRSADGRDFHAL